MKAQHAPPLGVKRDLLTLRLSTGRVTLNLSMVLTMMAGVVRKKSRRKSRMLSRTQRSHQREPHSDRFSLGNKEDRTVEHLGASQSERVAGRTLKARRDSAAARLKMAAPPPRYDGVVARVRENLLRSVNGKR